MKWTLALLLAVALFAGCDRGQNSQIATPTMIRKGEWKCPVCRINMIQDEGTGRHYCSRCMGVYQIKKIGTWNAR